MASINTIPIELLEKIIDLTVEDAIAVNEEKLRRNILIRLALVSKDFTRPAQLALWRYMNLNDMGEVEDLITAGFGSDKVIEELEIWTNTYGPDGLERFNKLVSLLRGVKRVISITHMRIYGPELPLNEFFEIDGIQELKSIEVHNYHATKILLSPQARPPSQLRHLTIAGLLKGIDHLVSRLIESSSSTLVSIELIRIKSSQYSGSKLSSVLASLGSRLQKLEVADCDNSILSNLIPYCTSLKSLNIEPYGSLSAQDFEKSSLIGWIQFLNHESGNVRRELYASVKGNVDFMELVEKRGIILGFGTEEQVRLEAEREKQRMYQERQEKLDSGSNEEEEVAESKE